MVSFTCPIGLGGADVELVAVISGGEIQSIESATFCGADVTPLLSNEHYAQAQQHLNTNARSIQKENHHANSSP